MNNRKILNRTSVSPPWDCFIGVKTSSFLVCQAKGVILQSSNDTLPGKWNLSFAFIIPVTSIPSMTLQLVDLTESSTVSVAEPHPRTITASCCSAHFCSFLRRPEAHRCGCQRVLTKIFHLS